MVTSTALVSCSRGGDSPATAPLDSDSEPESDRSATASLPIYTGAEMTPRWLSRAEAASPDLHAIARESYFADAGGDRAGDDTKRDASRFLHTEKVFLIDKARHIRGVYDGTRAIDVRQLIEDIRALEREYASPPPS